MKKIFISLALLLICGHVWGGELGLPEEQIALPSVQGNYLVCIWDDSLGDWVNNVHQTYDNSGSFSFQLPSWGKWYWIGLWDSNSEQYVFGKWIGHFLTN